ncbi:hypothetical protein G6F53_012880 [Rhizopus delemar]|nr:hypothetical protein G6F53_012880 [Rhizopus delemar]
MTTLAAVKRAATSSAFALTTVVMVMALVGTDTAANPKYAEPIDEDDNSKVCTRPNNRGEGKGLGWNGYCCKTSDDCRDTCIKGKCNGKVNPKYA